METVPKANAATKKQKSKMMVKHMFELKLESSNPKCLTMGDLRSCLIVKLFSFETLNAPNKVGRRKQLESCLKSRRLIGVF